MAETALGEFLRARRRSLRPEDVGVVDYGPRRVSGLRRRELAELAGISVDYYIRLEQGRDRHPSLLVLDALARALRLDEHEVRHLRRLAEPSRQRLELRRTTRVRAGIAHLVESWTEQPAIVLDRYQSVIAANPLARLLNAGYRPGRNLTRFVFLDPEAERIYDDWDHVAKEAVATLRAAVGIDVDDPQFTAIVDELLAKSQRFRQLWDRHEVRPKTIGRKRFNHPLVGGVTLNHEAMTVNGVDEQTLVVFFADPGSGDEQSLIRLAGLAAGEAVRRAELREQKADA